MFDIEILGYSFYYEHDDRKYPIINIEARHEDIFLGMPIKFERVYDAYDWVYNRLDGTLDDMIKNFVDELWKEFHKGIPKVYEISLYISLPVGLNMWIKEHIRNELNKRLAIKRDEDKFYRALSNMKFGLGIEPDINKTFLVLGRGSGKWETQMKMLENYIKTGKVEFVPNRDIRTLLPESCYIDTDLVDSIMDTCIYTKEIAKDRAKAKEKIKEYEKMQIENVIFNDPATIVFWRDGSKTVVKAKDEPFDPEKGLAMAIAKKAYGNEGNYYNEFKKFIKDEPKVKVSSIEGVLEYLEPKEEKNE